MFPMTMTIHNPAQLNAVLMALQHANPLAASDFKDPDVGAAYVEASERVAKNEKDAAAPTGKPRSTAAKPETPSARSSPTAEAVAAAAPAQSTAQPEPQLSTEKAAGASSAAEPVTYDQVARAISAAVKRSREHVVATLKQFGAAKGPELKAEQYAAFLAALAQPEEATA